MSRLAQVLDRELRPFFIYPDAIPECLLGPLREKYHDQFRYVHDSRIIRIEGEVKTYKLDNIPEDQPEYRDCVCCNFFCNGVKLSCGPILWGLKQIYEADGKLRKLEPTWQIWEDIEINNDELEQKLYAPKLYYDYQSIVKSLVRKRNHHMKELSKLDRWLGALGDG